MKRILLVLCMLALFAAPAIARPAVGIVRQTVSVKRIAPAPRTSRGIYKPSVAHVKAPGVHLTKSEKVKTLHPFVRLAPYCKR